MTSKLKKMQISFFKTGVRDDIEQFKLHVRGIENYLENEVKELVDYHEARTQNYSDEEKDAYYEFYSDEYWQLNEVFPSIQRKSELVGVYSVLEHNLNLLCSIYEKNGDSKVLLKDIKGKGIIDTARKYLVKVVGINFPSNHSSWSEIKSIQKIRNLFVHNDGKLKGDDSNRRNIESYVDSSEYLKLDQFNRIIIEKGFVEHALKQFRLFFDELCNEVDSYESEI